MRVLRVVTLTLLAALTLGQMDGDFCKQQQPTLSTKAIPMPDYSPEFVTTLEVSKPGTLAVDVVTLHFSTANQILTADYRKPTERIMAYVFPRKDTYMESTFKKGRGSSCTSEPLEDSTMANDFNIHRDPKTKQLTMPAMSFLISHTHIRPPVYIGPRNIRGIPAQGWYICAYQAWTNVTIAGKLYYSSQTQMPGTTGDVPLKMDLQIKAASTGAVHAKRYDYFNYVGKINKNDKHFQIPSKMYCKNAVTADNLLPNPPFNFEFQAIQKDLGDINAIPAPKPALAYRKETYSFNNHLYVQDEKSPWNLLVTEVETRIVHDYTAGLQYDIDVSTGACEVHPIDTETADFTKIMGNFVTMKSPKDFFQLSGNNYQYMGEHHYFDRDITADVYTSVTQGGSDQNPTYTMMTWWFASKSFLSQMKYDPTYMMPLRFRVQKSDPADTNVVDFYQFTSPPSIKDALPDLTPCFPVGSELYLQITFKGSFNSLYLDNPVYFHSDFETAMLGVNMTSMVRIAQFRVKPVDKDHMVVQFTLLDKPSKQGNALHALSELSNKKIWPLLKHKIDTGTFFLTVHNDFGVNKVMATGYRVDFKDPKSFSGKASVVAAQTSSSSSSSGYSSGAMGGLAIGMLLLGLILGFVVIKLIQRHRDGAPDISMEQLGKRT